MLIPIREIAYPKFINFLWILMPYGQFVFLSEKARKIFAAGNPLLKQIKRPSESISVSIITNGLTHWFRANDTSKVW